MFHYKRGELKQNVDYSGVDGKMKISPTKYLREALETG